MKYLLFPLILIGFGSMSLFAQPTLVLDPFANGFTQPVDIAHSGDSRLFVVQRNGYIFIVDSAGNVNPTPFLDIDARVLSTGGSERGLLGLVFHPQYPSTPYFYVDYINSNGDTRVSRFSVTANPDSADPNSEVILLTVSQPYSNHNGGDLAFGPDGYLYISFGDGGSGGDPQNNGQTTSSLLGKILRLDVNQGNSYAIPPTNPFVHVPNINDEIWAYGLRNPWRFSFDRLTGDMWIGDVGQNQYEEIDFQPATSPGGENYGWRCFEGTHNFNQSGCGSTGFEFPVFEYAHSGANGCSVTGGFVYRGSNYSAMYGYYVFADYCSGRFWTIYPDTTAVSGWMITDHGVLSPTYNIGSFGENVDGEIFVAGTGNGIIYQLKESCNGLSVSLESEDVSCAGLGNGSISVAVTGGTGSYTYSWSHGPDSADLSGLFPGTYSLTVTDSALCSVSASVVVQEGIAVAPAITISGDTLWAGSGVSFQWYQDSVAIPGANDSLYVAADSGKYYVEVTDINGCTGRSEEIFFIRTTVDIDISEIFMRITPNPGTTSFTLTSETRSAGEAALHIFDLAGREWYDGQTFFTAGWNQWEVTVGDLPAGVYIVQLLQNGQIGVLRWVRND